jgi:polygalacturonase
MRRRDFLGGALGCGAAGAGGGWDEVPRILARIRPPQFPEREFDLRRYGAAGDGKTDCRESFAKAIAACHGAGGGRVSAPAGMYLCNGPIHLAANIELRIGRDATLRFGCNPADYLPVVPVRWEGTRCRNYSPLIYANGQDNIAITGEGTIDGQTTEFWHAWKQKQAPDQNALREMGSKQSRMSARVFGEGHYLRPTLIEPYECRNVLIEGLTLKGSPFWTVHPVYCSNVTVRRLHILPGTTNDDGIDPDSCSDVLIEDCVIETEDDNIAIKAGRDQDAWGGRPCENLVIRGVTGVRSRANGLCIGSEMSGDVRNVFIQRCTIGEADSALNIKSNSDRGGMVEGIWAHSITAKRCNYFIRLETDYKGVVGHPYPAEYRDFHFNHMSCGEARKFGIYAVGVEAKPIGRMFLGDIEVERAAVPMKVEQTKEIRLDNVHINGRPV